MCKCTPNIRTPFCGKPGCEWPGSKPGGAREQVPSKDLVYLLRNGRQLDTDGAMVSLPRESCEKAAAELERLRTALSGIQSCSTCSACRGAATMALGGAAPEPRAAPAMDTSNTPAEDTQQKVVSAVHYHAREIARLTATWPVNQSYTAYDIELFDAGRGVAARMRPEQNGRYYLRSDVDAAGPAQPPGDGA